MHNAFIARLLDWDNRTPRVGHRIVNGVLRRLRIPAMMVPPSFSWRMANVELRMNLFHLASQVAAFEVPGAFVELGCNAGESSVVIQSVLDELAPDRELHVYDSFEGLPPLAGADRADGVYEAGAMRTKVEAFHETFARAGVRERAQLHQGYFEATIPSELPDEIAFAFIDCDLESSTAHVLPHVYERMAPGAICMFGVYCDESVLPQWHGKRSYKSPGVKRAADAFFADKPEKPSVLYANEYSNGYFRKLASNTPAAQRAVRSPHTAPRWLRRSDRLCAACAAATLASRVGVAKYRRMDSGDARSLSRQTGSTRTVRKWRDRRVRTSTSPV